ncbi:MAG: hypothetical protein AVDCRST_MAG95-123, partial [uncultured Adhaeribacter sp.]
MPGVIKAFLSSLSKNRIHIY